MIVECGQCHTKLRMDASKIPAAGAKVRCAKCRNVFRVAAAGTAEAVAEIVLETSKAAPPKAEPPKPEPKKIEPAAPPEKAPPAPPRMRAKPKQAPKPAPAPPKEPSRITNPARRILTEDIPTRQRILRVVIGSAVALIGVLLGLSAMGVRPLPRDLGLLFGYGQTDFTPGLNILRYEGRLGTMEDGTRNLVVRGTAYNNSREPLGASNLRLEVLSTGGEFLTRKIARSLASGVPPFGTAPFSIEVDLPAGAIGRLKVMPEK
jgi:predicted Zn finger-like uncharacterized protein